MICKYTSTLVICCLLTAPLMAKPRFSESPIEPWGADCELIAQTPKNQVIRKKDSLGSQACQQAIRFFQVYISPIDGPRSSYYPSSSQYTLLAIKKYGVLQGIAMGCDRLMRENGETWIYPITNDYSTPFKLDPVR